MKFIRISIVLLLILPSLISCDGKTDKKVNKNNKKIEELMQKLTLDEKVSLTLGTGMLGIEAIAGLNPVVGATDFIVPGAAGTTTPLDQYGIPAIVMTDGPGGVRISPKRENSDQTYHATGFPVAIFIASSWDTQLATQIGRAIADEALEYGSNAQLAPGMNIMRDPLCGRNYEYYSEDPILTGKIAVAMTNGLQQNGVAASPKHFAANNNETNRMSINVHASQRALREIYFRPFEIVVKESNPATIMSSYNLLNGKYTSADYDLLTTLLRDEWGFEGLVMTDWYGGYAGFATVFGGKAKGISAQQIAAGNDLLMPGLKTQKEEILEALKNKELSEEELNTAVRRILNFIFASPKMNRVAYSDKPDLKAHAQMTRRAATDGMVLLKNDANTLPLDQDKKKVAAFGVTSYNFIAGGMGSGYVFREYTVSLLDGLKNADYKTDKDLEDLYAPHLKKERARIIEKSKSSPFPAAENLVEMPVNKKVIAKKAKSEDVALITIGRNTGEFVDRKIDGDFNLTSTEQELIDNVSKAFHAEGKKVVVILNIGGIVEMASWQDKVDAVLIAWMPGQEGGNSVVDVLDGKVNPSGKLPMTIPVKYTDVSTATNFPNVPDADPTDVSYKEGIYIGYRYFDSFDVKPAYEFGYGMSYTQFEYSNLKLSNTSFNKEITISITVKNIGKVAGKDVAQLYLSAPKNAIDKPRKELKAFGKTQLLEPNETQTLTFLITAKELASFVPNQSAWVAEKGTYEVLVGNSSKDIKEKTSFNLSSDIVVEKVNNILNNDGKFEDLKTH